MPEAAHRIGLTPADLAQLIRAAGVAPALPEQEWLLAAAEVDALLRERQKRAAQNAQELQKLEELLGGP